MCSRNSTHASSAPSPPPPPPSSPSQPPSERASVGRTPAATRAASVLRASAPSSSSSWSGSSSSSAPALVRHLRSDEACSTRRAAWRRSGTGAGERHSASSESAAPMPVSSAQALAAAMASSSAAVWPATVACATCPSARSSPPQPACMSHSARSGETRPVRWPPGSGGRLEAALAIASRAPQQRSSRSALLRRPSSSPGQSFGSGSEDPKRSPSLHTSRRSSSTQACGPDRSPAAEA
mmetsp:Transcript_20229/g.51785  ORF Transcript_20229/g.51785 Transcript_20229/m.51785 type:complete len:238 (+) Transcript_20229:432-1145(+)